MFFSPIGTNNKKIFFKQTIKKTRKKYEGHIKGYVQKLNPRLPAFPLKRKSVLKSLII